MLTVVTGPPAAGKSTYVRERSKPGDIVIDFDVIAVALSAPGADPHDHPPVVAAVARAAREAAIEAALRQPGKVNIWLIHSSPGAARLAAYRNAGAQIVTVDPGRDVVAQRIAQERPAKMRAVAQRWYGDTRDTPERSVRSTSPRAVGRPYRRARTAVLELGDICYLCGHEGADTVDHLVPRSKGGDIANPDNLAPAHGVNGCPTCKVKCNQSRGNGEARANVVRSRDW